MIVYKRDQGKRFKISFFFFRGYQPAEGNQGHNAC